MSILNKLLPTQASNDYHGSPIALYIFVLLAALMLFRSLIHFLKEDSGVNSIATIILFNDAPDPNQVIYMFSSLWGSQQLIMVFIYAIVLLRYRNLIPLMYALFIVEVLFRLTVGMLHPLTPEYYAQTPPGKLGNIPILVLTSVMLFLSLRTRPHAKEATDTASTT
ncbi:MAG: hypothetical protein AAF512_20155 [Pseudomonadota bacterium]